MKIKIITALLLLVLICGAAKGQDTIVPITLGYDWPLSSPILDSVEYFTAKNIAKNKVRICEEYDEKGNREKQFFYDRQGRLTSELNIYKDSISSETNYTRNSQGQITEETYIAYSSKEGVKYETQKYEYLKNKPVKAFLDLGSGMRIIEEGVYAGDTLSAIRTIDGNYDYSKKVYRTKNSSGIYTFVEKEEKSSLFENANMDSVVVGNFSRTIYKIKNHRIVSKDFWDVDYGYYYIYHYDDNGLLSFTDVKYDEVVITQRKLFYKYYYYEN